MKLNSRLDQIVSLLEKHGFLTVGDLSRLCDVSMMTIRRDLEQLDTQMRIQRTYGGAIAIQPVVPKKEISVETANKALLLDQIDVLIATSVTPYFDALLVDRALKKKIPLIAESIRLHNQATYVAVDNYQAGLDLGHWAGDFICKNQNQKAIILDLTFHQPNTKKRSQGFLDGIRETCPSVELALSINPKSHYDTAYQLCSDALKVYPEINLIFAINDTTALGAINACRDLKIDPKNITVIPFGLEGPTLKEELLENQYCKAGLAMFPEIVGMTCVHAAINAYNRRALPEKYTTPHKVLTASTLTDYYTKTPSGWEINWKMVHKQLRLPVQVNNIKTNSFEDRLPKTIGLIVPFIDHEWYKLLADSIQAYVDQFGIKLQIIDAEQNVLEEVEIRRRQIAHEAARLVETGNVLLIDSGPISGYLAEELREKKEITVITNSMIVLDTLNHASGITLISTGGAVRFSSQTMVGPTAENALKELRADLLFLSVSGVTSDFDLSHHTVSEVTIKQALIRSARKVILLADHTTFGADAGIQVAPLSVANILITDDALSPSTRLAISSSGIQIILAST